MTIPISGLPAASAVAAADFLPVVQGGVTRKVTATQLASFHNDNLFDVTTYAGWDPIAANNNAAFTAAILAANTANGGKVLLPRQLKISTLHPVTSGVDLVGRGGNHYDPATTVLCTAAGAGLQFGTLAVSDVGGISSGFCVDGDNVATSPMRLGATIRGFQDVAVVRATDTGFLLDQTQNTHFDLCTAHDCNDLVRIQGLAATNLFTKCEFSTPKRYGANLGGAAVNYNVFDTCIFEYPVASTLAMVNHTAGTDNLLRDCVVAVANPSITPVLDHAVVLSGGTLRFHGGTVQHRSNVDTGVRAFVLSGVSNLFVTGRTTITATYGAIRLDGTNCKARMDPWINPGNPQVADYINGATSAQLLVTPLFYGEPIAATTLGTVKGKILVTNQRGDFFGFIPLYDNIT